jgi:hypothetical protein
MATLSPELAALLGSAETANLAGAGVNTGLQQLGIAPPTTQQPIGSSVFPNQNFGDPSGVFNAQNQFLNPFTQLALPLFQQQSTNFANQQANQAQLAAAGLSANASLGAAGIGAQAQLGSANIGAQASLQAQAMANKQAQAQLQAQIDSDFALAQFGDQNAAFRLQANLQQARDLANQATTLDSDDRLG